MAYPQITEYHEAVQHPQLAFVDPELKQGTIAENNLGLPLVMSGGFALTYAVTTAGRKYAVRCFHREIPAIQQKYNAISNSRASASVTRFFLSCVWTGSKATPWACGSISILTTPRRSPKRAPISRPLRAFWRRRGSPMAIFRT